jgi:hypothetical protein
VCDDGSASHPFVITGLNPRKTYDLYIASSWGQKGGHSSFRTTNKTATPSPQTADNRSAGNASTWVRGTNFVFFQDMAPDSSGQISLSYGGVGTYGMLNGFQLLEFELPTSTFESWAANPAQGLTAMSNDGPLDDPDDDGISNLLEFTLGGMPTVSSQTIQPMLSRIGDTWVYEYDRSDAARPPSTTQVVEYSSDLLTWTPVTIPVISGGGVTIRNDGPTDHVQVTLPANGKAMFARLRVSNPSPYEIWASSAVQALTPGVNDGFLDDPDFDQITNLVEFVLRGEPMVSSPEILPTISHAGNELLFEYDRSDLSLPPATTQVVEYSRNLIQWTSVTIPATSNGMVTIIDGASFDHVKVAIPMQGTTMFARLKVYR